MNRGHINDLSNRKSEDEWKAELSPEAYYVCRKKGTERAFTGSYHDCKERGVYLCHCCGAALFDSETKFNSGTGWPSFYQPSAEQNIEEQTDRSFFRVRTEVLCKQCGAHLGHVFNDGPEPTGLRYCINSVALNLQQENKSE